MNSSPLSATRGVTAGAILSLLAFPGISLGQTEAGDTDPAPSRGKQLAGEWQPPPPPSDEATWIQLTSGEWLKGEIVSMFRGSLTFDSDKLDDVSIDWEDVQEIRSPDVAQVAFEDGAVAVGKLQLIGDDVRVLGEPEQVYPRTEVLSIISGAPTERSFWSGKVTSGLNLRSGNTDQTDFTIGAEATRRTPKTRIRGDYIGNVSDTADVRTTDSHRVTASWSRLLSPRLFWVPLYGEYYRDTFSNIDSRWTGGTGLGYLFLDSSKVSWEISAGVAYQHTEFVDVLEGDPTSADTPALIVGTDYDHELASWLDFFFDYDFQVVNEESGTYSHHLITGLGIDIVGSLDFDISWTWDRIEDPQQNADGTFPQQDDFRLVFGLGYSF